MRKSLWSVLAVAVSLAITNAAASAEVAPRLNAPVRTFQSGMIRVEQFGKPGKPAVILIPGLYCGSWEWNRQIPLIAAAHAVYAVTLPGFDGLPSVRDGRLMKRAIRDIHALIVSERLHKPTIVGHSLGGTLAIDFAEEYPQTIGAVISAEGGYPAAQTQAARQKSVEDDAKPFVSVSQAAFGPTLRKTQLQYVITNKRDVDAVERLASRSDPKAVVAWMRAALTLDLTPGLSKIRGPFIEIVPFDGLIDPYQGYKSLAQKRAAYDRFVAHAPHGRVIMVAHSRHFMMFDQPELFNRALFVALLRF